MLPENFTGHGWELDNKIPINDSGAEKIPDFANHLFLTISPDNEF